MSDQCTSGAGHVDVGEGAGARLPRPRTIGVAQYAEGPTGATVFRFVDKAVGAVDVRGGAPGAYNVDWLRWGYGWPNLDALVVSGGSWYGLATSGGVAGALKDVGHPVRSLVRISRHVAGAIIYDFGPAAAQRDPSRREAGRGGAEGRGRPGSPRARTVPGA